MMRFFVWYYPSWQQLADAQSVDQALARLARLRAAGLYLMAPEGEALDDPEPLRGFLRQARDRGLEVHLGLLPFSDPPAATMEINRRRYCYQDRGQVKQRGLCPAWSENRILALNRVRRLLEEFEPDGLHLDYARYWFAGSDEFGMDLEWDDGNRWASTYHRCQCAMCQSERLELLGREATGWDESHPGFIFSVLHRRHANVKAFVKQVRELCHQSKTRLSVAVRALYLSRAVIEGQDWVAWARDGLVDVVSPMNYSISAEVVKQRLTTNQRLLGHAPVTVYEGLGRKSSAGEPTPEQFAAQVRVVAEAGLPGAAIFHLDALTDRDYELLAEFP